MGGALAFLILRIYLFPQTQGCSALDFIESQVFGNVSIKFSIIPFGEVSVTQSACCIRIVNRYFICIIFL